MSLETLVQKPSVDELVTLFQFDATSVGAGVYFFAQAQRETSNIVFQGQTYVALDVEFEDFEINGSGQLPQPKMRVANTNMVFQSLVNSHGDLLGTTLYRVRTFRRFLDDGEEPDPMAFFGPDTYRVERKASENPVYIEWELSASIDQEGKMLPGRVVLRDTCTWRYRRWNPTSSSFDYSKATCPYTGGAFFKKDGSSTANPAEDQCGRRLGDCKLRFGANNPLPTGAYPGVARVRVS